MASSGEGPNKGINGSVGELIWVRQRNGLWWPGKILDPDVLPEGSVPSLRSGTPVKLLGKEGSSVGWYNLGKSKRVKAFHYEDHDKCIKKLKSFKYAKKDEDILHMLELELEGARLDKNHADHASPSASYPSEESENSDENLGSLGDDSGSGSKDESSGMNDLEENVSRRTRGLRDLGMKAPLLRKRKMSKIVNNQDILRKKNKRRTLSKALCSTGMLYVHDNKKMTSSNGDSLLETKESNEKNSDSNEFSCDDALKSKRKGSGISSKTRETRSSSLFDVPFITEEKGSAGSSSTTPKTSRQVQLSAGTQPPQSIHIRNISSSEHNEAGPTGSSAGKGDISEWQSKGKRKSRSRKTYPLHSPRSVPYRQSRFKYDPSVFSHRQHRAGPGSLHDVPLEVRSDPVRPYCLPYVSMASKLTGCSVVGHPLTVEVLANGSCDEYLTSFSAQRKTPRGGPRSKARDHAPLDSGKNGLLLKKTRKLSALSGPHRPGRDVKKGLPVGNVKGPSVACVPLAVVFSRINADLGGSGRSVSRRTGV